MALEHNLETAVLGRPAQRPRPSFTDALATGGGLVVFTGAFLLSFDASDAADDNGIGAVVFVLLAAVALALLFVTPKAVHPANITILVLSVPTIFGYVFLPDADSFDDIRLLLLCTILGWLVFFLAPASRGRPILIALIALVAYFWVQGEVADVDSYWASPFPTPAYVTPSDITSAIGGGDDAGVSATSLRTQVTLDDLDSSDPLYPLAEDCATGDLDACDQLYAESEFGSDFEDFGATCGGTVSEGTDRNCALGDDFGDDITDDTFTDDTFSDDFSDDFGDDFGDDSTTPFETDIDVTPLGRGDNTTLEIGIVSVIFGVVYLLAIAVFDRRRWNALATAFVIPAVVALVEAAAALGDEAGSAIVGGLLTMLVGFAIGIVGYIGPDRRFTAWIGGFIASVGALVIAGDVAPEPKPSGDNLDLVGASIVVIVFGIGVVALAFLVSLVLHRSAPPPDGTPAPPPPTDRLGPYTTVGAPPPAGETTTPAPPSTSGWSPAPPPPADPQPPPV